MIVTFGDIFAFGENRYVYLTESNGVLYAARIISPSQVDLIERMIMANAANPANRHKNQNIAYAFVRLTTANFERHGAHLARTVDPVIRSPFNIVGSLNDQDRAALVGEILNEESSKGVPNEVKDAVRELSTGD